METKPPLGLKPRKIHDQDRMNELICAIERYSEASMPVPKEWTDELKDIVNQRCRSNQYESIFHGDLSRILRGK